MKPFGTLFLFAIAFAAGVLFDSLITRVSPESHVVTQMCVVGRGLKAYHARKGVFPATLNDLVAFSPDVEQCLTNSWGKPISFYVVDASNAVVTTTCYGDVEFVERISVAKGDQ